MTYDSLVAIAAAALGGALLGGFIGCLAGMYLGGQSMIVAVKKAFPEPEVVNIKIPTADFVNVSWDDYVACVNYDRARFGKEPLTVDHLNQIKSALGAQARVGRPEWLRYQASIGRVAAAFRVNEDGDRA